MHIKLKKYFFFFGHLINNDVDVFLNIEQILFQPSRIWFIGWACPRGRWVFFRVIYSLNISSFSLLWSLIFILSIVSQRTKTSNSKQRPFSAHVMGVKYFPAQTPSQMTGEKAFSSFERKRQLDAVEKKLRKTTALLQKKLSINPLNFVE